MFWRHGRTTWNAQGRFQGQTDIDLDPEGREQAAGAARRLAALAPAAIVCSDLRRARDTATPLARLTGLEVVPDPGLRETRMGAWEGLSYAQVLAAHGESFQLWDTGDPDARPPGGESRTEVGARCVAAVEKALVDVPDGGTLVVVSHGGAIRIALCRLLDLPGSTWGALGGLSNCSWSVLAAARRGWRLVEHNAGTLPEPVLVQEG